MPPKMVPNDGRRTDGAAQKSTPELRRHPVEPRGLIFELPGLTFAALGLVFDLQDPILELKLVTLGGQSALKLVTCGAQSSISNATNR